MERRGTKLLVGFLFWMAVVAMLILFWASLFKMGILLIRGGT